MRSSTVVALFAGSAAAQSSVLIFNPMMPTGTLTQIGSSEGTKTYVNSCSAGAGVPASYLTGEASGSAKPSSASAGRVTPSALILTPISAPSTTAAARLRRQENPYGDFCEPITIKQGASSFQYHLQDPKEGAWTADMNCAWKGEIKTADLTCTVTQSGAYAELLEAAGVSTNTLKASEIASDKMLQTVAIVTGAASPTASGSHAVSGSPTASGSQSAGNATGSASAPAATATGAAAGGPVPMGAMAFVGGAAGVFAAALAL